MPRRKGNFELPFPSFDDGHSCLLYNQINELPNCNSPNLQQDNNSCFNCFFSQMGIHTLIGLGSDARIQNLIQSFSDFQIFWIDKERIIYVKNFKLTPKLVQFCSKNLESF